MRLRFLCLAGLLPLIAACNPEEAAAPKAESGAGQAAASEAATSGAAAGAAVAEDLAVQIAEGREIAEMNCARCHALGEDRTSPRSDAPPMRDMLARYDAEVLATDLIEGIKLGHEDMPVFDFNIIAADSLVAYLKSIRPDATPGQ